MKRSLILLAGAALCGCTMFRAATPAVTVTRISILQDFNAKTASVKIDTNGVPTFTFAGVGDDVSPQLKEIVAAAVEAAIKGAKP